jgi:predicted HTH domain antitoxin
MSSVAVTPDNHSLLYGAIQGDLIFWDIAEHHEIDRWRTHHDIITAIAVTDDGHYAFTGDDAGHLKMWDLELSESQYPVSSPEWLEENVRVVGLRSDGQQAITVTEVLTELWKIKPDLHIIVVVNAYLDEKISLAKAAEMLDMTRFEFERELRACRIPVGTLSQDDVLTEVQAITCWNA